MSALENPKSSLDEPDPAASAQVVGSVAGGVVGVLMWLAGMALGVVSYVRTGFAMDRYSFISIGLLVGSLVIFAGLFIWTKKVQRSHPLIRRALTIYNVFLACALLAAALGIGNLVFAQYVPATFDWTSERIYTLAPETISQLKSLEKPVTVIVLAAESPLKQRVEELLDLYHQQQPELFKVEYVDRYSNKTRAEQVLTRFPDANVRDDVLIVTYGTGEHPAHKVIEFGQIFAIGAAPDREGLVNTRTVFKGEDAITSAIAQLRDARKTNVYFTTGHQELAIASTDATNPNGIGLIKERAEGVGMKFETIDLARDAVPSRADLIVIAGPKVPFSDLEVRKLRDYLAAGGRMIAMLDPGLQMKTRTKGTTGLEPLLAQYNVKLGDNFIVDRRMATPGELLILVGKQAAPSALLNGMEGGHVLFYQARSVDPLGVRPASPHGGPPGGDKFQAQSVLSTGRASVAIADYANTRRWNLAAPGNIPGPVSVVVTVSETKRPAAPPPMMPGQAAPSAETTPRLVVFGDSDFASNPLANEAQLANQDLMMNALNWLRGRIDLTGIAPRERKPLMLRLTEAEQTQIWLFPSFAMFALLVGLGTTVWASRRRSEV